jgi:hypothetical protein
VIDLYLGNRLGIPGSNWFGGPSQFLIQSVVDFVPKLSECYLLIQVLSSPKRVTFQNNFSPSLNTRRAAQYELDQGALLIGISFRENSLQVRTPRALFNPEHAAHCL